MITPEQALANTRALLEARHAQAQLPPSYPGAPSSQSPEFRADPTQHAQQTGGISADAIHGQGGAGALRGDQAKRDGG